VTIDYDSPQASQQDEFTEPLDEQKTGKAPDAIDLEEAELAETFELPGEELLVNVIPVQSDDFTCMSCFLVHHRSQPAREEAGKKYYSECEG